MPSEKRSPWKTTYTMTGMAHVSQRRDVRAAGLMDSECERAYRRRRKTQPHPRDHAVGYGVTLPAGGVSVRGRISREEHR